MYLYNLKLWNFRKYGSEGEIDLEKPDLNVFFNNGLNLLTGENDSGKTAIIDAIKLVLKTSSYDWVYISDFDFYNSSKSLRIEILFRDISEDEGKNFIAYYSDKEFDDGVEQVLNLNLTADIRNGKVFTSDIKAGIGGVEKTVPAEVRELLKVTYLKPLRNVQSELVPKRNSRLSQIFQGHEAFRSPESHVLVKIYEEFNESIKLYFEGKDNKGAILSEDQNGKLLKQSIDDTIKDFFDKNSESNIETTEANVKRILESLRLTILGVDNPGLGSLNRLFMASELIHLNKENWSGLRLGLIEEIEAHLHPQVQLKVIKSLLKQKDTQLILTTHSPNLASKVPLKNQIICRNNSAYSLSEEYTNLDAKNYVFLEKFLDVTKSNLLFAKGLILVEGWSEELLIPIIADKIGYNLIDNEVSIINVGNLGFSNYYKIFSRKDGKDMDINISVITDCDVPEYEEEIIDNVKSYIKIDKTLYASRCKDSVQKKSEVYEDIVKPFIAEEWTLEWCLMKSTVLSEIFKEITKDIHNRSDWSDFQMELAKKLFLKTLGKSEIAYRMAQEMAVNSEIEFNELENDPTMKHIVEAIKHACE